MSSRDVNERIREAVVKAVKKETLKAPFNLYGRGHEPRLTLDIRLAAILRGMSIPCVHIAGFGSNRYYPARVFMTAKVILRKRMRWSPIEFGHGCVYRVTRFERDGSEL